MKYLNLCIAILLIIQVSLGVVLSAAMDARQHQKHSSSNKDSKKHHKKATSKAVSSVEPFSDPNNRYDALRDQYSDDVLVNQENNPSNGIVDNEVNSRSLSPIAETSSVDKGQLNDFEDDEDILLGEQYVTEDDEDNLLGEQDDLSFSTSSVKDEGQLNDFEDDEDSLLSEQYDTEEIDDFADFENAEEPGSESASPGSINENLEHDDQELNAPLLGDGPQSDDLENEDEITSEEFKPYNPMSEVDFNRAEKNGDFGFTSYDEYPTMDGSNNDANTATAPLLPPTTPKNGFIRKVTTPVAAAAKKIGGKLRNLRRK